MGGVHYSDCPLIEVPLYYILGYHNVKVCSCRHIKVTSASDQHQLAWQQLTGHTGNKIHTFKQICEFVIKGCVLGVSVPQCKGLLCHNWRSNYPVRVCAAGLCVWSHRFVYKYRFGMYVCMYVCLWPKNWLFEVLPLENLSFVQSTAHSLSLTVKKGAYYARRFVQGKNFGGILLTGWEKGAQKIVFR